MRRFTLRDNLYLSAVVRLLWLATLASVLAMPCRAAVDSVTTLCITDRSPVVGFTGPLPVTQSFILSTPATFSGNVAILLDGGDGNLELNTEAAPCGDTTSTTDAFLKVNSDNFLTRSRWLLASDGFVVITLNEATDFKATGGLSQRQSNPAHLTDLHQVIVWARTRYPGSKVWIVGTSRATAGAFLAALAAPPGGPDGLVFASPINSASSGDKDSLLYSIDNPLPSITVPTLVASNPADACPGSAPSNDATVVGDLVKVPVTFKLNISFPGGNAPLTTDPCDALSFHGYFGIEPSTVNSIAQWMLLH